MFSHETYARLYRQFKKPILRYVKTRIADENVAEELTQEVFFKVYRSRDEYHGAYAFSTWLWTIARNTITDHLRVVQRAARANAMIDESAILDELPCPRSSAEELVIQRDERRRFFRLARCLTRPQRRVLWLRLMHQRSYEEISAQLGLSLPAVKNLAYRGRLSLASLNISLAGVQALA